MCNLSWGFPTQNLNNQNKDANDAGEQAYNEHPISSIVREALQNSLDAASARGRDAVKVEFSFGLFKREVNEAFFAALLSAKEHIQICHNDARDAGRQNVAILYQNMMNQMDRFEQLGHIPFLKIKDSGTIGMNYDVNNLSNSRLATFIHTDGRNTAQDNNGGGANGIGKMAYFVLSPFRMVLVSTCANNNGNKQTLFSGTIKLVSHSNPNNRLLPYQHAGYMPPIPDDIEFKALCGEEVDNLPFMFSRRPSINEAPVLGSTIYIIGCEPNEQLSGIRRIDDYRENFFAAADTIYEEMEKEVLRHYWLAIREKHLQVQLGAVRQANGGRHVGAYAVISDDNIIDRIKHCFGENVGSRYDNHNPLYFIKALDEDNGKSIRHYELNLDECIRLIGRAPRGKEWGKVNLYLNIDERLQGNMIIAMRSPLMTVCRYRIGVNIGSYAGVLVCNKTQGYCNEILRAAESHTHAGWSSEHAKGHGYGRNVAGELLEVIKEWVEEKIKALFEDKNAECGRFMGMSKYLCYNPADATQRASELNDRTNVVLSGETTKITKREPGARRTQKPEGIKVNSVDKDNVSPDDNGSEGNGGGGKNGGSGGNGSGNTQPTKRVKKDKDGKEDTVVTTINLNMRYFAKEEAGKWKYVVLLSGADRDYDNVILRFTEQQESLKGEPLQILKATGSRVYKIDRTKLHNVSVKANEVTKIEVEFQMNRRIALGVASILENESNIENE